MIEIPPRPNEINPDGLGWGLHIHRYYPLVEWRTQLARVPEVMRQDADTYLRAIAERIRTKRRLTQESRE